MQKSSFFNFPSAVVAFFSDRSRDFTLRESSPVLTEEENAYLALNLEERPEQWAQVRQVHGDRVVVVSPHDFPWPSRLPEADALVTSCPNVALLVRTADCLPVFLFDPRRRVIALVHAGWRGTQKEIVVKALRAMKECGGASPQDVLVALGPAIRSCCYEVGPEFKSSFPAHVRERSGRLYFDLAGVNIRQLREHGVLLEHIQDPGVCTGCAQDFFSYRREGSRTGRHLSLLMLR